MIYLDSEAELLESSDRIPVFTIDDTTYSMPSIVRPHVALKYLWLVKIDGPEMAASWLLETMLGYEGFKALANFEALTDEQFNQIINIIQEHALGSVEEGKGPSSSGNEQKKSSGQKHTKKT